MICAACQDHVSRLVRVDHVGDEPEFICRACWMDAYDGPVPSLEEEDR